MTDAPTGSNSLRRMALVLTGGGVTGAMYEIGCLAALEDALGGFSASEFDVYVGTGAGATIAAVLAGGVAVKRMYRAMLDPQDDFFPLERRHFFRFDTAEWRRLVASATGAARRSMSAALARPAGFDLWQELDRFYDSLPAGVFNLSAYEDFLAGFFERRGVPNRFVDLPRRLFIPAGDLDAGGRVVFGLGRHAHVPVARAVCASSAIPIVFAPVRVGDRDYVDAGAGPVGHADVALRWGADLVVAVNPLVAVRNDPATLGVPTGHGPMPRVRDKGLLWVYEQTQRMAAHGGLAAGLRALAAAAPHAGVLCLEPRVDDATMFMYSPMNFAARRTILRYGYDSTTAFLRREGEAWRARFAAHGIELRV